MEKADLTTPLVSPRKPEEAPKHKSNDETIEDCIGDFGWKQFFQALLISLAWVFDAQQTFISVFTDARPAWHCNRQDQEHDYCRAAGNICQLPRSSWSWDKPDHSSIVSEWSLECTGSVVTGLPASSFFMGCLAGGLMLSTLADSTSLGRKNMLLLSCLLMSLAGAFTVFSSNMWIYSALRFVCGFGRATIATCALVLATELVGKRWRGQVGIMGFFCFTVGFLSLPALAYLTQGSSWRLLYLWTCIPALFYCVLIHFFVHESPRWLFVRAHEEELLATRKSNNNIYSAIKMLVEKRWAVKRLAGVMGVGFGTGMVYYGMPLGVGSLGFNLYLSVTLNALSELPATLVTFFLIGRLNRKASVLGFNTLSAICSVTCGSIMTMTAAAGGGATVRWRRGLEVGLELVAFFGACTGFNVLLIYTLELFPTCVRNSAVALVRQALVLGGVVSPVLVAAAAKYGVVLLSYGVFGVTIGLCGLFVTWLPETRGRVLSDTMEEEQHKLHGEEPAPAC